MSYQMMLPTLADEATQYIVEHYYVAVDAPVVAGQVVALVRSERFAWDIPATASGVISALLIEPGGTIVGGARLIELHDQRPTTNDQRPTTNDQRPTTNDEQHQAHQNQRLKRPSLVEEPQRQPSLAQPRVRATPVARRMAANHDVDLALLSGTGRGNIITRADVLAVIGNREQEAARSTQHAARSTQHAVSPSNLPYALAAIEADLSAALDVTTGHERRARRGVPISTVACVAAATVAALGKHRVLNSAWSDDGIILRSRVHLLIEQLTRSGMQTALVPDAATLNLVGLARRLAQINNEEHADRQAVTFAIAQRNGPWWSHAQPDSMYTACLTIGDVTQQPRVVETAGGDTIALRPVVLLLLAYDARVANQHEADAFLCDLQQRLEHFDRL